MTSSLSVIPAGARGRFLPLLLLAGFRLLRVERDFFTPARSYPETMIENGIRLRDMLWMEQTLDPPATDQVP